MIISNNAISTVDNNGKTIRSLLGGFPRENIAQFYIAANAYPDEEVCGSYYRITDSQILKSILTFRLKTSNSHSVSTSTTEFNHMDSPKRGLQSLKDFKGISSNIRELLWSLNTWDTAELCDWISNFRPTCIFAVLGDCGFMHDIVLKLSERYQLPMAVFFTDDYVINDNAAGLLKKLHQRLIRKKYKKILQVADKAFVIGDLMKEAYTAKYNRPFGVLVNGIDFNKESNSIRRINPDDEIIISFIGGIHLNRWKTIVRLGSLLKKLPEYNVKIKVFTISTPETNILEQFEECKIEYCGALNQQQVDEQIKQSHILLHVESFEKAQRQYTHFSISTKIPEYLASNRGIIAFGPHEIASIRIFSDNSFGCVLTDMDDETIMIDKLRSYLNNYNSIDFNLQYNFAKDHFSRNEMLLHKLLNINILPPPMCI